MHPCGNLTARANVVDLTACLEGLLGSTGEELVLMVLVGMRTEVLDVKLQTETRSFIMAFL